MWLNYFEHSCGVVTPPYIVSTTASPPFRAELQTQRSSCAQRSIAARKAAFGIARLDENAVFTVAKSHQRF